jgi:hypothetical protein
MECLKKFFQCYCFSGPAYYTAVCVDEWHSIEACGLSYIYCVSCLWSFCAPICIECKLGDISKSMTNCVKGIKFVIFSCALTFVSCFDGCYNCFKVIEQACSEGIKGYGDLTKNTQFFANKVKAAL